MVEGLKVDLRAGLKQIPVKGGIFLLEKRWGVNKAKGVKYSESLGEKRMTWVGSIVKYMLALGISPRRPCMAGASARTLSNPREIAQKYSSRVASYQAPLMEQNKQNELFTLTSFLKSLASGSGVWLLLGLVFMTLEMASTEWSRMSEKREIIIRGTDLGGTVALSKLSLD